MKEIKLIQNGGFNKIEFEETEQGKANREFFDNLKMIREELVTKMTMDHLND